MMELYEFLIIVAAILVLFVAFWDITKSAMKEGYKQGQADAIEGKIKIKLVEFKDGSRRWYYEEDLKDLVEHTVIK